MRLEDYLNQTVGTSSLGRSKSRPAMANQAPAPPPRQDTVTISSAARGARSQPAGAAGSQVAAKTDSPAAQLKPAGTSNPAGANTDDRPALTEFKKFMDKLLGREGSGGAKSREERTKEVSEKIKKLHAQLSEVVSSPKISDSAKSNQVQSINSQIKALEAELAELSKPAAGETQAG
jgi:hypothetical protein